MKNIKKQSYKIFTTATLMVVAFTGMSLIPTPAQADEYDEKIKALQQEIDAFEAESDKLKTQANTLSNKIADLKRRQTTIQTKINSTNQQIAQLKKEIEKTNQDIIDTRTALGNAIADMYVMDEVTPIEMLASSDNVSDYLDRQEFRSSIRDGLKEKIGTIKELKEKLEEKQRDVERTLLDQKNAKNALVAAEKEQQSILQKTRNDEAAYQKLSSEKRSQQAEVQRAQQAAIEAAIREAARRNAASAGGGVLNISGGDGSRGGYPWGGCHVDANALSYGVDPLGYGCRQCVSYAAWKTVQKTGYSPYYWGNANMWPANASAAGFATGSTPKKGALGVISAGQYGHIVYIEDYDPNAGTVRVSQYNYFNAGGAGWGHYSEMTVPAWTYDTYIYIQ